MIIQGIPLFAADQADAGPLATLKSGLCQFKVLASDGVKPLAGAVVKFIDGNDEKKVLDATADKAGKCSMELAAGRFILSINDINVSVLDIADNATISECRIIMPDQDLQVGGDAQANAAPAAKAAVKTETKRRAAGAFWATGTGKAVIGGVLVLTTGGIIVANNQGKKSSNSQGPSGQ